MGATQQMLLSYKPPAWNWLLNNLLNYYKLDWNSTDNVGTTNWTDTSITYSAGKISDCASFNGTSSKIAIPISMPSTYTWSFWLYHDTYAWYQAVVDAYASSWTRFITWSIWGWWVISYDASNIWFTYSWSTWVRDHVVLTFWSWTANLYINNVLNKTDSWLSFTSNTLLHLWVNNFTSWWWLWWKIDEFGVRNTVLDSTKRDALYNWWSWLSYSSFTA